ncbi:MAG: hypothetical protein ACKV2T_38855 [Kofleriaceae bacterium]
MTRAMMAALLAFAGCSGATPDLAQTKPRDASPNVAEPTAPAHLEPPPASAACGARGSTTPPQAIAQIGVTTNASCARLADHSVWCWGARGTTRIDNDVLGSLACSVATRVTELSPAAHLAGAACIARDSGGVRCGELDRWLFDEEQPLDARSVFYWAGERCAITKSKTIRCTRRERTTEAATLGSVEQVAFLDRSLCVLAAGRVTCRIGETNVVLGTNVASIASAERWLWATRDDGTLLNLQLCGAKPCEYAQNLVQGLVSEIASSGPHTCIRTRSGRVWCERRCTVMGCKEQGFIEVAGIAGATHVAVSPDHACVAHESKTVSCWGESNCGQAGGGPGAGKACGPSTSVPPTTIQWAK